MYNKCDGFRVYHTNIQSVNGRLSSLLSIANTLNVDLVTVNETNLRGRNKFHLEGFKSFFRNRKEGNMGGVSTSVRKKDSLSSIKVCEGKTTECLITRHGQFVPAINIINVYEAQESRQSAEEIINDWETILEEIVKIEARDEAIVNLGDLNRHLSNLVIKDNHAKSSLAGRLLMEFVTKGDYSLVNAMDCVVGGPFTR